MPVSKSHVRYAVKVNRNVLPLRAGTTLADAMHAAAEQAKMLRAEGRRLVVVKVLERVRSKDRYRTAATYRLPGLSCYQHRSWWTTKCSHSSCGTVPVWFELDPHTMRPRAHGIHGGPSFPFDPGHGAVVMVTVDVIPGKVYPPNPYDKERPRRRPSPEVEQAARLAKLARRA